MTQWCNIHHLRSKHAIVIKVTHGHILDKSHLLVTVLLSGATTVYRFTMRFIVALNTMPILNNILLQVKVVSDVFGADVQNAAIRVLGGGRNGIHGGQDFVVVVILGDDLVRSVHLCYAHDTAAIAIFESRSCHLTALLVHCHFLHHLIPPLVDVWVARAPLHSLDAV